MKILSIDTSTIAASAAIIDEYKLHGEVFTDYKLKHSEKLLIIIDSLLKNLRMDIEDIDYFAVSNGPGSFTGLRIALATIKGFAIVANKPIITVSTLDVLAHSVMYFNGIICPVLDAQRNQLYSALYKSRNNKLDHLCNENVFLIPDLINILNAQNDDVLFLGDATIKYYNQFKDKLKNRAHIANINVLMPKASYAALIALEKIKAGNLQDHYSAMPNYLRVAQAEENLSNQKRRCK
jgi:tRNA threonylcarbamoyl adenosine modification protein YeaZ